MNTNPNLPQLLADLRLIGGALYVLPFVENNSIVIDTDKTLFTVYYNQSAFVTRAVQAAKFYGFEVHNTDIHLGKVQLNFKQTEAPVVEIKPIVPIVEEKQEEKQVVKQPVEERKIAAKLHEQKTAEQEEELDSQEEITITVKQLKTLAVRANLVKPKFINNWIYEEVKKLKQQKAEKYEVENS